MSHQRNFKTLPVEIFHILFDYFSTQEILRTFLNISDYLNAVLNGYSNWSLNFKSISRDEFDFICHQIQPEKVISLTISDDCDTPGQSELFFSRFQLEQFVHLRCLRLINIESESLEHTFTNLHKLKQMKSFSLNRISIDSIESKRLEQIIFDSFVKVFPNLYRLAIGHSSFLEHLSIPRVRYLKITMCSTDKLKTILNDSPCLQSLCTSVYLENKNDMNIDFESSKLTRLHLKIYGHQVQVSMNQMEQFLSKFSCLKYLRLILKGKDDLVDGYRWEMLTNSLVTFNFYFDIGHPVILNSFHNFYWLEDKHWHVRYQDGIVFTTPYFYLIHMNIVDQKYQLYSKMAIKYVTSMTIYDIPKGLCSYFTHIKKLSLTDSFLRQQISPLLSFEHVESLSLISFNDLLEFQPYETTLPKLSKLIIKDAIKFVDIIQMKTTQIKQIQILKVTIEHEDLILEGLFFCFPLIKYLQLSFQKSTSGNNIIHTIDTFIYTSKFSISSPDDKLDFSYVVKNSKRLQPSEFTYRVKQSNRPQSIVCHWWIVPKTFQSYSAVPWPSSFKYFHRYTKFFFSQIENSIFGKITLTLSSQYCSISIMASLMSFLDINSILIQYFNPINCVLIWFSILILFIIMTNSLFKSAIAWISYKFPPSFRPIIPVVTILYGFCNLLFLSKSTPIS
ncbi:hypothetical protein I4U23_005925 [Adineta vaga]|nr:hypothetical protein I4U23_005925 [Adineta vaga]